MISGRHEGLRFCGTAQRPALVHVTARANAERIRWFRVTERNDLDAARDYMPGPLADSLPRLPDYVCIETSDGSPPFGMSLLWASSNSPVPLACKRGETVARASTHLSGFRVYQDLDRLGQSA